MSNYFMGLDGFIWFIGVVEDRNDPSKLGRVKVRCLGFHTEDKNDIPTQTCVGSCHAPCNRPIYARYG